MHGLTTLARLNAQATRADAILEKHEVSDKAKAARGQSALVVVRRQDRLRSQTGKTFCLTHGVVETTL